MSQRDALRRADDKIIHPQGGGKIEDGRGRILAHRIDWQDTDVALAPSFSIRDMIAFASGSSCHLDLPSGRRCRHNKPRSLSRRARKGLALRNCASSSAKLNTGVIPRAATMIFCPSSRRGCMVATRVGRNHRRDLMRHRHRRQSLPFLRVSAQRRDRLRARKRRRKARRALCARGLSRPKTESTKVMPKRTRSYQVKPIARLNVQEPRLTVIAPTTPIA